MPQTQTSRPGYSIQDAAKDALFWMSQGNGVELSIRFACTLRGFGPGNTAKVRRVLTKNN